jgi:hypothetical protein
MSLRTRSFAKRVRLLAEDGLAKSLRGENIPEPKKVSTIDKLFKQSRLYKDSAQFNDLVKFMGRFRDYAPYNNMLVRLQNPSCSFYARAEDWRDRFRRSPKEDARPMLILAPMHPVMLVYDLDQTEGSFNSSQSLKEIGTRPGFRMPSRMLRAIVFVSTSSPSPAPSAASLPWPVALASGKCGLLFMIAWTARASLACFATNWLTSSSALLYEDVVSLTVSPASLPARLVSC